MTCKNLCSLLSTNKCNNDINNDHDNNNETIKFASHITVEFLSTLSLILFSSCNKAYMVAVKTEVFSQKILVAQMNTRFKELLGLTVVSHDRS